MPDTTESLPRCADCGRPRRRGRPYCAKCKDRDHANPVKPLAMARALPVQPQWFLMAREARILEHQYRIEREE